MAGPNDDRVTLTDEQKRQRGRRNVALAVVLASLAVLFYVMTFYKFAGGSGSLN